MSESSHLGSIMKELSQIPETHLGPLVDLIHYYRMGLQAEAVQPRPRGRFSELSGVVSNKDADEMMLAINEGCERIDPDGW